MARATLIPINGDVLEWAMHSLGVGVDELAQKCGTSPEVIESWAAGERQPTKTEFKKLVARLRRPSTVYFLAEPPEEDPVIRAFRSPPGSAGPRTLTDLETQALTAAERIQKVAKWIRERRGDDAVGIPDLGEVTRREALASTREFLNWPVSVQLATKSPSRAARLLREHLERSGILVLQFSMRSDGCRGFALHDPIAPVIAVNSAYTTPARIFSYLHEFAHLAYGAGSICSSVPDSELERRCEGFAAAFLMPKAAVLSFVRGRFGVGTRISTLQQVQSVANHFRVSLRAAAYRLQRLEVADRGLYATVDEEADFKAGRGWSDDNGTAGKRLREWGTSYAELLLDAEQEGWLGRTDVLEYLSVAPRHLAEVRSRIENQVGVEG